MSEFDNTNAQDSVWHNDHENNLCTCTTGLSFIGAECCIENLGLDQTYLSNYFYISTNPKKLVPSVSCS